MNGRRGFLALVGGTAFAGGVLFRKAAATPTLILPPATPIAAAPAFGPGPFFNPLLAQQPNELEALLHVKRMVPLEVYRDWLEGGLRQAKFYRGRDLHVVEDEVDAAIDRHGSIVAARRAGAL